MFQWRVGDCQTRKISKTHIYAVSKRLILNTGKLKVHITEKIRYVNTEHKTAGATILISDKGDFWTWGIIRSKKYS